MSLVSHASLAKNVEIFYLFYPEPAFSVLALGPRLLSERVCTGSWTLKTSSAGGRSCVSCMTELSHSRNRP